MPWHTPQRFRRTPPAGFIRPCLPTLVANPPGGPGWLHEVKHDGFRTLARKQGERVEVWSRYGTDFTARFSKIAEAVRGLPAESALIDGEAVAFLPGGHSDFAALRTKSGGARASYVAFDLLSLEGDDLRQRPLEERRKALSRLVTGSTTSSSANQSLVRARLCSPTPARSASRASCRSVLAVDIAAGRARTG